jgi:hypothetical protein
VKPKPITPEIEAKIRETIEYRDGRLYRVTPIGKNTRGGVTYSQIVIFAGKGSRAILAHRLVYFLHHGVWPENIDHRDGNRDNNRIENLRPCTHTENMRNRGKKKNRPDPTMPKGVRQETSGRFLAYFHIDNRKFSARFDSLEEALNWRKMMEKTHYGDFGLPVDDPRWFKE